MADSSHRWRTIDELFAEAVELSGSARGRFLDRACANRPALRAEVERMLWADEAAGSFLRRPWLPGEPDPAAHSEHTDSETDDAGLEIGAYRLVERIAAGGMGAVYRAQRADGAFERDVAVKLARRRIVRAEDVQRFRTERQVLARLDHPNIARLLDGGTAADGRPYLVMELIDGPPIDSYCRDQHLSLAARIELFQQVCSAIEYAHQNFLIHRDIKPDNILVARDGTVKVLDFGIARLLDPESLRVAAPMTRTGVRPMTPGWASPEQIRGEPATSHSEVFVLGALLYAILTGRSPFTFDGALPHEIDSAICAVDGLPSATTRGSKRIEGEGRRALRGDLGTILGKALRADPAQRYSSVARLSDDLTRWSEHRPVRARPDRLAYRTRRFIRRHRALAAAAGLLVVFAVVMTLQAFTTARERDRVQLERAKAEQVSRFLIDLFEVADPEHNLGATLSVEDVLERGAARIGDELAGQPLMQATLSQAIGEIYHHLGLFDRAGQFLEQALDLRRQALGDRHLEVAESLSKLAQLWNEGQDLTAAEAMLREALDIRRAALGEAAPEVAESLEQLSDILSRRNKFVEAESLVRRSLAIRRRVFGDGAQPVARSLAALGRVLGNTRHYVEAEATLRQAIAIGQRHLDSDAGFLRSTRRNLAQTLRRAGKLNQAEPIYREVLASERRVFGPKHPQIGFTLTGLGAVLKEKGDYSAAQSIFREALDLRRSLLPPDHPAVMVTLTNLADLAEAREDFDHAERLYRETLAGLRQHLGAESAVLVFPLTGLGRVLIERGEPREAETHLRRALALRRLSLPADNALVAQSEVLLARSLVAGARSAAGAPQDAERYREAEQLLLAGQRKLAAGDGGPGAAADRRAALSTLADLYSVQDRPEEAATFRRLLAQTSDPPAGAER
ncbi:MAG: serine/threonine-protein kinase [Acidobacteriota bacterium]